MNGKKHKAKAEAKFGTPEWMSLHQGFTWKEKDEEEVAKVKWGRSKINKDSHILFDGTSSHIFLLILF